jgi:hypothetical protein
MDKEVVVKVKEHKTKDKEKKQSKWKYNTFIMVDQTTQKVKGKQDKTRFIHMWNTTTIKGVSTSFIKTSWWAYKLTIQVSKV